MSFSIIDKNARKREGPRAQRKYINELREEWIEKHAALQPDKPDAPPEVPENVRRRYAEAEAVTRKILEERATIRNGTLELSQAAVVETEEQRTRRLAERGEFLMKKLGAERSMLGKVRSDTVDELLLICYQLDIDPDKCIQFDD